MPKPSNSVTSTLLQDPLVKKAYNAFHNAKQRCENENHPSYPKYGKLGVKMLFESFESFWEHIETPPNLKVSLDRINPHGNYECGNVRWSNAVVQAHNKKGSVTATLLPLTKQIQNVHSGLKARSRREDLARCWSIFISAIMRGHFFPSEVEFLSKQTLPLNVYSAGWELGQVRDLVDPNSFFHLPSITQIGGAVRLEGGPLPFGYIGSGGVITGLTPHSLLGSALDAAKAPFLKHDTGAVLVGGKSEYWRELGGVEGIMMVLASYLRTKNVSTSLLPLMTVLQALEEIGPTYRWHEEFSKYP